MTTERTNTPVHHTPMETTAEDTCRLKIADIVCDRSMQVRGKMSDATVKRYADGMRYGAAVPPVTVALVNGAFVLVDGWHRLRAAQRIERMELEAVIVRATDDAQARWMAAEANLKHGLPIDTGPPSGTSSGPS